MHAIQSIMVLQCTVYKKEKSERRQKETKRHGEIEIDTEVEKDRGEKKSVWQRQRDRWGMSDMGKLMARNEQE